MSVVLFDVGLDRVLHVVRLLEQHLLDLRVDPYSNRCVRLQLGARLLARHKLLGARLRANLQKWALVGFLPGQWEARAFVLRPNGHQGMTEPGSFGIPWH